MALEQLAVTEHKGYQHAGLALECAVVGGGYRLNWNGHEGASGWWNRQSRGESVLAGPGATFRLARKSRDVSKQAWPLSGWWAGVQEHLLSQNGPRAVGSQAAC